MSPPPSYDQINSNSQAIAIKRARCDYAGCSNLFTLFPNQSLTPSTHSLIILLISCITFIHSFLDGLLYLSGNLRPVYVLSTSVIMMVFWLVAVGLGAADITKAAAGSNYEYCVGAFTEKYFRRLGCWAPKARLGIEVSILYVFPFDQLGAEIQEHYGITNNPQDPLYSCHYHGRSCTRTPQRLSPLRSLHVAPLPPHTGRCLPPQYAGAHTTRISYFKGPRQHRARSSTESCNEDEYVGA